MKKSKKGIDSLNSKNKRIDPKNLLKNPEQNIKGKVKSFFKLNKLPKLDIKNRLNLKIKILQLIKPKEIEKKINSGELPKKQEIKQIKESPSPIPTSSKKLIDKIKQQKEKISSKIKKIRLSKINLKKELKPKELKQEIIPKIEKKSSGKESIYTTDLDKLYDLIQERNIVKLSEVTNELKVDKTIAQKWGNILEEHELIQFHFPAVGEPEFRKLGLNIKREQTPEESKKKKIIISIVTASIILLLIISIFIIRSITKTEEPGQIKLAETSEPEITKEGQRSEIITKAFSGQGTYICAGPEVKYYIKDNWLRAESLETNTTVIVKEEALYTYNKNNNNWIKSNIPEDLALPGSGKLPSKEINCKEEEISNDLFNIQGEII
ncbi:MAG: hypothetical protein AABW46_02160 [Nanoarchaeota archaeon]